MAGSPNFRLRFFIGGCGSYPPLQRAVVCGNEIVILGKGDTCHSQQNEEFNGLKSLKHKGELGSALCHETAVFVIKTLVLSAFLHEM